MRKFSIRSTVLATAIACSTIAFAATPPPPSNTSADANARQHAMHRGGHGMGVLDQLDLTDAQRASVRQLFQQNFAQIRPQLQSLQQKRIAFENATPGSSGYQTAANALAEAESNAAHTRVLRQAELRTKIYNLLTPAQRTQLASIRTQREAKMKQWREAHMQRQSGKAPASSATAH